MRCAGREPAPGEEPNPTLRDSATTRELAATGTAARSRHAVEAHAVVLGRYSLERRIGAGGHGTVWQALDERLEREVAVKVIPRGSEPSRPRAEREARVAARLNHPGIVGLYELGEDDDAIYLVSELVRGRTLADLEAAGALSDRDVARIGVVLCDALAHAHRNGVVHRDVKPQNVIVVAEPAAGAGFAKLTDFGIAHVASGEPLTRTGDVVGTLAYMAPEQAAGRRVTEAADVYALALVLYEAWTGVNPHRDALAARPRAVLRPEPLGRLRRDLPAPVCRAVDRALDSRPECRPPLGELASALEDAEAALSDAGGLVEPGALERVGIARRRAPLGADLLASTPSALGGRAAAGLAAGGLVAAALATLGPTPPVAPTAAGAVAVLVVALLPRVGWLTAAVATCLWLALPSAGRAGTALVLAAALAPIPLLLPRAGKLWSAPAIAPLLGAAGLAVAFPAVAGLARTTWRRAALGALGFGWLVAAELVSADSLLYGVPSGAAPPRAWQDSPLGAATDALYPALASPALVPALAFACLAAVLPLAVGRRVAVPFAVIAAAVWAATLALALSGLGEWLGLGEPRGAAVGAALGAALAVTIVRTGLRPGAVTPGALP